jgi:hypothetical protein
MSEAPFHYLDEQWRALEAIVARAGGDEARKKFAAERLHFEKSVGGYKSGIARDGHSHGGGDPSGKSFDRVKRAAQELGAALDDFGFPQIFAGDDLIWKSAAELIENDAIYSSFREALKHVGLRAERMAAAVRKRQVHFMRDRFFLSLARTWQSHLGLRLAVSADSSLIAFIRAASAGVLDKPPTKDIISNVIRRWKPQLEEAAQFDM